MSLHYPRCFKGEFTPRCFKGEFTLSQVSFKGDTITGILRVYTIPGVLRVSLHYHRCFKGEFTLSRCFKVYTIPGKGFTLSQVF